MTHKNVNCKWKVVSSLKTYVRPTAVPHNENLLPVSHTTDDMIFQWDPDVPLVVDEHIELPQLALVQNHTADCTQVYSTGNFTCLEVVFVLKRRLGYYLFHTYIPTCLIVIMSVCWSPYVMVFKIVKSIFRSSISGSHFG